MLKTQVGLRVLVADDSSVVRKRLVAQLNEIDGADVVAETVDVPATLAAIRLHRPHVVLLDIGMPGGSGLDVLRIMAKEKISSFFIVLTNYTGPEWKLAAMDLGADAFLAKSHEFCAAITMVGDMAARQTQGIAKDSGTV